jgi:hypothetical protein
MNKGQTFVPELSNQTAYRRETKSFDPKRTVVSAGHQNRELGS